MNLKTDLLPHQRAAVEKVLPIRVGALFMQMGTGKSRTAIELVYRRQDKIDRVVWFCPVSLKETVRQEILKHTDCTPADICVFNDRTNERNVPTMVFWYIVGIETMSLSRRVIFTVNKIITESTMVILDESSYIKGHNAKRTNNITQLSKRARYRLILTGTPMSQGVVDLFAQMRFLSPKILGYSSFYSFAANHLEYSEKYPGMIVRAHNTEYLAAKIQPYVYQVTKKECLNLPRKTYETFYCTMTAEQWHYYELAKEEILMELLDDEFSSIAIFRLFSVLQQIVCGFWNRKTKNGLKKLELEHERFDVLKEIISGIPSDEKIIIWAKYRYDIEQIGGLLESLHGPDAVAYFHGGLNEKKRNGQVQKFKADARFFVATQSTGGHGLTLNEAHYVIFYNNTFKYSERLQAEDRCHRIGQENRVVYIDIECRNSIDERISQAMAKKGNAVEIFKREVDKIKDKKAKLEEVIKSL